MAEKTENDPLNALVSLNFKISERSVEHSRSGVRNGGFRKLTLFERQSICSGNSQAPPR